MRSVLSLVQLCSCSYLAQTSSEFCIHTKSFHLLFERSDKWVQSRGAQSLQGCESGQGEKYQANEKSCLGFQCIWCELESENPNGE